MVEENDQQFEEKASEFSSTPDQAKRSEEFQRGLGKSQAEIEETRRFLASGEQPSAERQSRYQSQEQAQQTWRNSEADKRSIEHMRGMGKGAAEIETELKSRRAYNNRVSNQSGQGRNKDNKPKQGSVAINREVNYANQLALERDQETQTTSAIQEEGRSFGHPSLIKYFLLFFVLAIPNDAIDAIELTGFLVIIAWFVSIFLSITSILIFWFTDQEQKRAKTFMNKIEEYQRTAYRTARTGLMVAKFFRNTRWARRVMANPTFKLVAGSVLELIPFLSVFPWSSISVILAYLDERKIYKEAKRSGEEVPSATLTEAEAT